LLFLYSTDFHFTEGLPSVCSLNRSPPIHTYPSGYGYSYAVTGVKLEPSRYIAAGRLLLSRSVRTRAAVLRTHFLFEVNHVEVYNNIKFPFTRFVGSALFLRQKTHSLHPKNGGGEYLFIILRNVNGNVLLYGMRMISFLFILIFGPLDNINYTPSLLPTADPLKWFVIGVCRDDSTLFVLYLPTPTYIHSGGDTWKRVRHAPPNHSLSCIHS